MTDQPYDEGGPGYVPEVQAPPQDTGHMTTNPNTVFHPPSGQSYQEGGPGYVPPQQGPPPTAPQPPASELPPAGYIPAGALAEIIDQALARQSKSFDEKLAKIQEERDAERQAAITQAGDLGLIAEHAGGPGLVRAATWSFHDQQLAIRGEHPLQQQEAERQKRQKERESANR